MNHGDTPIISIIMPVYHVEKYIDTGIESVLAQSFQNIEVLLMVGMCKDASLEKCIEWQKKDDRIIIVSRNDHSLGDARNYALKMARGTYIAYVDADDYIDKDYCYELWKPLEDNPDIDITCCGFNKFLRDGSIKPGWRPKTGGEVWVDFERYFHTISYGVVWLKMYRRQWMLENRIEMFDGCHEDDAMSYMLAARVKKVYLVPKTLYHYNADNENSLFHNKKNRVDFCNAMRFAVDYLKSCDVYEKNRWYVRKIIMERLDDIREETGFQQEFLSEYESLVKELFPEVKKERDFRNNQKLQLSSALVVFGSGLECIQLLKRIDKSRVTLIIDNNEALQGTCLAGIPIVSLAEMKERGIPMLIVISSSKFYYEMAKELRENELFNYISAKEYERIAE